MAQLDKIRLSGTTYDIIDATAIHSLDGYYTTGETNAAITAATNALAESIAEQGYQTSGDVQNAVSGKADTTAVTQSISEATSGKADTTAVTQAIDEAVSGKIDSASAVTNVEGFVDRDSSNNFCNLRITKGDGSTATTTVFQASGQGLKMVYNRYLSIDYNHVAAKSDIPSVSGYADSVTYNSTSKYVEFYHGGTGGTKVFEYDASPFLIDGMVDDVEIKDVTISGESVTCLVISFNTAAGKQDINIPISEIFDASNYYTKDEVDAELSAKTDNSTFTAYTAATDTALGNKADTTAMTQAISEAVSGKADTTAVTQSISEATSGKVDTSTYTAYTADTATALGGKASQSDLEAVSGDVATKQDQLVSGTNIKTINNESILGSGNITIEGGNKVEVSGTTLVFL